MRVRGVMAIAPRQEGGLLTVSGVGYRLALE